MIDLVRTPFALKVIRINPVSLTEWYFTKEGILFVQCKKGAAPFPAHHYKSDYVRHRITEYPDDGNIGIDIEFSDFTMGLGDYYGCPKYAADFFREVDALYHD